MSVGLPFAARHLARTLADRGRRALAAGPAWWRFWRSYRRYCRLAPAVARPSLADLQPCLFDATAATSVEPTYFHQSTWAFARIVASRPREHIDVGSHHTFTALLSTVLPVTMVDIRPLSVSLDSLRFQTGSILALPFPDRSIQSLSSLCVVEHVGLGRYGDPLDPDGSDKAIAELARVLAPGGDLYLSLPLDDADRTFFNAHRAFTETTLERLWPPLEVVERRYVTGNLLVAERPPGPAIGCYRLRRSPEPG